MEFKIEEPDKKIRQEIKANWDRLAKPLDGLVKKSGRKSKQTGIVWQNRWMVWGSLRDFSQGSGQSLGRQRLILRKKQ